MSRWTRLDSRSKGQAWSKDGCVDLICVGYILVRAKLLNNRGVSCASRIVRSEDRKVCSRSRHFSLATCHSAIFALRRDELAVARQNTHAPFTSNRGARIRSATLSHFLASASGLFHSAFTRSSCRCFFYDDSVRIEVWSTICCSTHSQFLATMTCSRLCGSQCLRQGDIFPTWPSGTFRRQKVHNLAWVCCTLFCSLLGHCQCPAPVNLPGHACRTMVPWSSSLLPRVRDFLGEIPCSPSEQTC